MVTVLAPLATIATFAPSGKIGDTITITGTNFVNGATTIRFNGTSSSTVNVASATSLTAVVTVGATTGTISVTTAGGTATSGSSFTVLPNVESPQRFQTGGFISGINASRLTNVGEYPSFHAEYG
jgi:hypothetical protein